MSEATRCDQCNTYYPKQVFRHDGYRLDDKDICSTTCLSAHVIELKQRDKEVSRLRRKMGIERAKGEAA